jgi:hypothetical protein
MQVMILPPPDDQEEECRGETGGVQKIAQGRGKPGHLNPKGFGKPLGFVPGLPHLTGMVGAGLYRPEPRPSPQNGDFQQLTRPSLGKTSPFIPPWNKFQG